MKLRREAAKKEEEDERKEKEQVNKEFINKLAKGTGDPEALAVEAQNVVLKKSTARRSAAEKTRQQQQQQQQQQLLQTQSFANGSSAFNIKGLKPVQVTEPEKPYDVFGGLSYAPIYHTLQDHYENQWLHNARTDPQITAGGYDVKEYYARTMMEAFGGLGCFIAEEVACLCIIVVMNGIGTAAAAAAAVAGGDDDVF